MQAISLREFQLELLKLLEIVHSICEENEIPYWIDGGTLLGAVRHGGFIPWDDDIDLCLLKWDYDRLLPLLYEYSIQNEKYLLFFENNKSIRNWSDYFCKLTVAAERPYGKGIFPVHIDILPVKAIENSMNSLEQDKLITDTANYYIRGEIKYPNQNKHKFSKNKEDLIHSKQVYLEYFNNYLNQNKDKDLTKMVFNYSFSDSLVARDRPYYCYSDIFPIKPMSFEGKFFNGPAFPDSYLRKLYNNYMMFPPETQQCSYHNNFFALNGEINVELMRKKANKQYLFFTNKSSLWYAIKRISYYIGNRRLLFKLLKEFITAKLH